jgi:hypothetical protein
MMEVLSPSLGITKEITSRGPQVLDMEYREPDDFKHGPGGPLFSSVQSIHHHQQYPSHQPGPEVEVGLAP